MRILGTDKPRQRVSRVDFERIAKAVSATKGMHAVRLIGVGAAGSFTRAKGGRQAQVIHATDIRVRRWQLAFK